MGSAAQMRVQILGRLVGVDDGIMASAVDEGHGLAVASASRPRRVMSDFMVVNLKKLLTRRPKM